MENMLKLSLVFDPKTCGDSGGIEKKVVHHTTAQISIDLMLLFGVEDHLVSSNSIR